jgi:CelD/BcsL family acetyltransferase involved in cellulose biosynthesis
VINSLPTAEPLAGIFEDAARPKAAYEVALMSQFDHAQLQADWHALESRAASSFFTSWAWISAWLTSLPAEIHPQLITVRSRGEIVGLGLVVVRDLLRHRVLPVKSMHLHSTGAKSIDVIAIEYNDFLVDRRYGDSIRGAVIDYLAARRDLWEELSLPGIARPAQLKSRLDGRFTCNELSRPVYDVDLSAVRARSGDYLGLLGADTRYQIRRSIKRYAAHGELRLNIAQDARTALQYFEDLKHLHVSYWHSRGKDGAFYSAFANSFHQRLISDCFDTGQVQLVKVSSGAHAVGYLYNFVHNGRVYAYQSGIDYAFLKGTHPGLLMHALAVEENAKLGHMAYDFMAGEYRYKRSMCTGMGELTWLTVQRDLPKLKVESLLRRIKWRLLAVRQPRSST